MIYLWQSVCGNPLPVKGFVPVGKDIFQSDEKGRPWLIYMRPWPVSINRFALAHWQVLQYSKVLANLLGIVASRDRKAWTNLPVNIGKSGLWAQDQLIGILTSWGREALTSLLVNISKSGLWGLGPLAGDIGKSEPGGLDQLAGEHWQVGAGRPWSVCCWTSASRG